MPSISTAEYAAMSELRYEIRKFVAFSERAARAAGVEARQYQVLLALKGIPAGRIPNVAYVADRMLLAHHSAVELVRRCELEGYVERSRSETDGRVVLLALTARGERALEELARVHRRELETLAPVLVGVLRGLVGEVST